MPAVAGGASTATDPSPSPCSATAAFSAERLPTARTDSRRPSPWVEIPAESYPRYSSFSRPARRTSCAAWAPTYPTIPHMGSPPFRLSRVATSFYGAPRGPLDRGGVAVREPGARLPAPVRVHDPGRVFEPVEQVAVVEPGQLVVDRPRLSQRDVLAGLQIQDV